jgi:hypothetical protein
VQLKENIDHHIRWRYGIKYVGLYPEPGGYCGVSGVVLDQKLNGISESQRVRAQLSSDELQGLKEKRSMDIDVIE